MDVVVENLSKSFDTQKAVDSVSFKAEKGEILGLLGPNGAGKTTTMRMITGFLHPDQGEVYFDSYPIRKQPQRILPHIGYIPEHNPLYEEMNVVDFLIFSAKIHHIPRYKIVARILDMVHLCGLEEEKHKTIGELSKGYKQRVGIAQALLHDPEVILLDEPMTGLDPNQIVEIRELIRTIGKEKTVILCSHILSQVEATCDKILILNRGRIVTAGTSAELRHSPTDKTLNVRIAGDNADTVRTALEELDGMEQIEKTDDGKFQLRVAVECPIEKEIFELCVAKQWYINEITPVEKHLEEIFRQVTQN